MFTVTDQQAEQRWDALTPPLREALFSDVNADFVWNLCQDNHLTEEKSYQVAELAGYVLYGFIHPEDLSAELVKSLDLPAPLAKTISDAINARVFMPLKADLDKVYAPLVKIAAVAPAHMPAGPKIMQSAPAPIAMPKPTTLSDVGWSKATPGSITPPRPVAAPAPVPAPAPARLAPTPAPIAEPAKSIEPAPVMLHEDTSFKAAEKNAGFTLSRPSASAEVHMGPSTVPTPPRSAVLEFGGLKPSAPAPVPVTSSTGTANNLRPPLATAPMESAGPRNVSQISSIPKPPTPPAPPSPPTPPGPPKPPQNDKPIVQDFL